jgi:hypothetical protein
MLQIPMMPSQLNMKCNCKLRNHLRRAIFFEVFLCPRRKENKIIFTILTPAKTCGYILSNRYNRPLYILYYVVYCYHVQYINSRQAPRGHRREALVGSGRLGSRELGAITFFT